MNIEEMLLTPNKYSRPGLKMHEVKKIVVHWVGNANSTAKANRNYFENLKSDNPGVYASSHYIIGLNGEIIRCVPESEIAYHGNSANSHSIGIENCHPDWNGQFNSKTYNSLIELCAYLCKKYNLDPLKDIIRHYDVTGKDCPHYYVQHADAWSKLKQDVRGAMYKVNTGGKKIKVVINGEEKAMLVIEKDGNNYIKLRDLEGTYKNINIKVSYSAGMPTVSIKS